MQSTATTMSPGLEVPMHIRLVTWLTELQLMWAAAPAPAIPPAPPPPPPPLTPPSQTSRTHAQTAAHLRPVLLSATSWTGAIPSVTAALPTAPVHRCVMANSETKHEPAACWDQPKDQPDLQLLSFQSAIQSCASALCTPIIQRLRVLIDWHR